MYTLFSPIYQVLQTPKHYFRLFLAVVATLAAMPATDRHQRKRKK
jgi:hypothetical protein